MTVRYIGPILCISEIATFCTLTGRLEYQTSLDAPFPFPLLLCINILHVDPPMQIQESYGGQNKKFSKE